MTQPRHKVTLTAYLPVGEDYDLDRTLTPFLAASSIFENAKQLLIREGFEDIEISRQLVRE
jgi:hypothetical protein